MSAVAHAWVDQVTDLRRAVERADGQGVEEALVIIGQAVARAVDGDANYERFAQHLEAVQPEEAVAPTRLPAAGFAPYAYGRAPRGMRFLAVMGRFGLHAAHGTEALSLSGPCRREPPQAGTIADTAGFAAAAAAGITAATADIALPRAPLEVAGAGSGYVNCRAVGRRGR